MHPQHFSHSPLFLNVLPRQCLIHLMHIQITRTKTPEHITTVYNRNGLYSPIFYTLPTTSPYSYLHSPWDLILYIPQQNLPSPFSDSLSIHQIIPDHILQQATESPFSSSSVNLSPLLPKPIFTYISLALSTILAASTYAQHYYLPLILLPFPQET